MANADHVKRLKHGVTEWNAWRAGGDVWPDLQGQPFAGSHLCGCNLSCCYLGGASFQNADLRNANLWQSFMRGANFRGADLAGADLSSTDLCEANFSGARLVGANLWRANLNGTNLTGADLTGAGMASATVVNADLTGAVLTGCSVFGVSVWDTNLDSTAQSDLIITRPSDFKIEVDRLDLAQFTHLLLRNSNIRGIIEALSSKVVLILGRFTPERKIILDRLRDELRKRNYVPILFDFEKPATRDVTETVRTLAHLAKFVIADITDAKCIPLELMAIVPNLPSVPVQPLLIASQEEFGMFSHFLRFPWVLQPFVYKSQTHLLAELPDKVIAPVEDALRREPAP